MVALTVVNQWNATGSVVDIQQAINPTSGNWLIAVVTWKSQSSAVLPKINLADPSRNVWYLLATKTTQANNTAVFSTAAALNVQVWACPAVAYAGWDLMRVYTAIETFMGVGLGSVCVKLIEVAGMGNGFLTCDSVTTAQANTVTSLTLTAPDPAGAADCLMIAAAGGDIAYGSYTTTGTGWTQLSNVTTTGPECGLYAAWREATTGGSVTFGLLGGATRLWAGVVVAIRQTGAAPTQSNVNWPLLESQFGFGYDLSTPLSGVWWTTLTQPVLSVGTKRGIGYELGAAQAEPTDMTIRNSDGALSPRSSVVTATATAAGTSTTIVCSSSDGANMQVGDYFKLTRAPLNSNNSFDSGTTGWAGTGGTLSSISVGTAHTGKMVPDGVSATVQVLSTPHAAVTAGATYTATAFLQNDVARTVNLILSWYDASDVLLSTVTQAVPLAAGAPVTASMNAVAPAGAAKAAVGANMTGTPPASNVMYLDGVILQPVNEFTIFQVKALSTVGGTTTVTYAPADGSAGGSLAPTGAGDVYTGTPVDLYTPYRQLATWGGKRHWVTAGWAERWPEVWDKDGLVGTVTMTGTGTLANLTATDPTSLAGEIMRRSPYAYWPLSDAAGAPSATNVSGRSVAQLVQVTSKNGAGGNGSAAFGASTQGVQDPTTSSIVSTLLGDPGSCWFQTGLTSAELNAGKGFALLGKDSSFPSITAGVTVFLVVQSPGDSVIFNSTINPTIIAIKNTDPGNGAGLGNIIKLSVQHNGTNQQQPIVTVWDKSSHASTATVCTSGSGVQNVDFVCVALTFNASSWSCYGSGGTFEGSGSCNLADKWTTIEVGGEADAFFNGNCYGSGRIAHVAVFDRVLTSAEIGQIDSAIRGHQGDEFTSNRVQRKLDTIRMTSARALSYDGQKVVAAESGGSGTVADLISQIGAYEDALVFEDAGAGLQYRPPALSTVQTSRATLGERADLGEVPYQGGVTADFDAQYLYNSITVTNSAVNSRAFQEDISDTLFTAIDSGSGAKYGLRTLARSTRLNNGQDAFGLAYWLLSQYATRKRRISEVAIDPASNPSAFSFCLTAEVGDLVTVMRRPLGAVATSLLCVVLQVEHSFSPGAWKTTLTLTPARPKELTLNDPVTGIVGSNVIGLE